MFSKKFLLLLLVVIALLFLIFTFFPVLLLSIGLNNQISGNFSGLDEKSTRATWEIATPFAIMDYEYKDTVLILVMKNNTATKVNLNSITIGASESEVNLEFFAGETKIIYAKSLSKCVREFSLPKNKIKINYSSNDLNNINQTALSDIVGKCA